MRSLKQRDSRVQLPPPPSIYGLVREYHQARLIQDFEFLSFSPSVMHDVAQYLVASALNHPHFPLRLRYRVEGKNTSERVVYDSIQTPTVPLSPASYFSLATVPVTVEETNDLLRRLGFSTADDDRFSVDRIHAMRTLFSTMPKFHSLWIRDDRRYVLFENGVVVRPLL